MMNWMINEATAAFMLPWAIALSNTAFEIIQETSLFLIPFIVLMFTAVHQARLRAIDESGSASMGSLQNLTTAFIGKCIILAVFFVPVDRSLNFEFKQVSCSNDGDSIVTGMSNVSDFETDSAAIAGLNSPRAPIAMLAINNLTAIFNGVAISGSMCDKDIDGIESVKSVINTEITKNAPLRSVLVDFKLQCYLPATSTVYKYISEHPSHNLDLSDKAMFFNGTTILNAMDGISGFNFGQGQLPFRVTENTIKSAQDLSTTANGWKKMEMSCSQAALIIDNALENYIKKNYANEIKNFNDTSNQFSKLNNKVYTMQETIEDFKKSLFGRLIDSGNKYSMVNVENGEWNIYDREFKVQPNDFNFAAAVNRIEKEKEGLFEKAKSVVVTAGNWAGPAILSLEKAVEITAYVPILNVINSTVISILIICLPIILLISGFSGQVALLWSYAYFVFSFMPFWISVGKTVGSTIYAMMAATLTKRNIDLIGNEINSVMLDYTSYLTVWILPAFWLWIAAMLGLNMPGIIASAGSVSATISTTGRKAATAAAKMVLKKG